MNISIGQPVATGARAILAGPRMPDLFNGESERREMASKDEYVAKYKDPRWQQMRLKVMERDKFACRICGTKTETLNAHHSYYRFGADPWDYSPDSIVTLCDECHAGQHANWECDGIREALCCNGFWSVYDRSFLAGALNGGVGDRPLSDVESWLLMRIVEAFAWSLRNQPKPLAEENIAGALYLLALNAPSSLPGANG